MTTPVVGCVCLTADRHEMTDRAVQCFLSQTYRPSVMLIYDTGKKPYRLNRLACSRIVLICDGPEQSRTIGAMRNQANSVVGPAVEVFAHWDSDDWSHKDRLADQVRMLNSDPTLDAVGYGEMLFWKSAKCPICFDNETCTCDRGAWIYRAHEPAGREKWCIGTSLMYWRKVWMKKPFEATSAGEDFHFQSNLKTKASPAFTPAGPLMIAELHGGNTHARISQSPTVNKHEWAREPGWDATVRGIMQL